MTPLRIALGIDVSRDKLDVALLTLEGRTYWKNFRNDRAGFQALLTWIGRRTKSRTQPETTGGTVVHVCLEATGGYEEAAARFLHEHELLVSVINPRRIKAYGESQLRRSKTDRAGAALIARFCQREQPDVWQPPAPEWEELRHMTRTLQSLKRDRDRTRNRLGDDPAGPSGEALEALLETYAAQIGVLEQAIAAHVQAHPELEHQRDLLMTIPGIGALTAALVLSELGDHERFSSARQAAAYAGLVVRHHVSGTSVRKRGRLSKVGNSRLRHALYFPALTALRHNEAVQALATRMRERGKQKMVIVGAAMRKLLHICFGVLRSNRPFDASLHPGA